MRSILQSKSKVVVVLFGQDDSNCSGENSDPPLSALEFRLTQCSSGIIVINVPQIGVFMQPTVPKDSQMADRSGASESIDQSQ